jgi:hypothetical protein
MEKKDEMKGGDGRSREEGNMRGMEGGGEGVQISEGGLPYN